MKWEDKGKLFRHSVFMFCAASVGHICNLLFQLIVGRTLSKEEFSIFASLIALLNIVGKPLGAIGLSIAHYVACMVQIGCQANARCLVVRWLVRMTGVGLLLLVFGILFAEPISAALHLKRATPVIIISIVSLGLFCSPVISGTLQGLQQFRWMMVTSQLGSIIRVIATLFFVVCMAPAAGWAILGHGVGIYVSFLLGLFVIYAVMKRGEDPSSHPRSMGMYIIQAFGILWAYATLMTSDVVLVQHYLPEESGSFAYAAQIARIVVFLPSAVATAMFPKVAASGETTNDHYSLLIRSVMYTLYGVVPFVLVCNLFPGIPLWIFFKVSEPDIHVLNLIRVMTWAMVPVALINVIIHFQLAQKRFVIVSPVIFCALGYLGCVWLWHGSVWHVAVSCAVFGCLCLLISVWFTFRLKRASVSTH